MFIAFELTTEKLGQPSKSVIKRHVTMSPFAKVVEEKLGLSKPSFMPLTFHW
jgi:hypothetical protein